MATDCGLVAVGLVAVAGQQVAHPAGVGVAKDFINPQPGQQIGQLVAGVPAVGEAAVCVTGIDVQVSHTCFLGGFSVFTANP